MTLFEAFSQVKDPRRAEGRRTSLEQIFSMVVVANLCGYTGYRPVGHFCKAHEELFTEELALKHGAPSHVTIRDLCLRTPQQQLIDCFNQWAQAYAPLAPGEWASGDGKALGSTVEHMHDSKQDFQAVVSLFCQQSGLVHLIGHYRNAKKSEREVIITLLEHLQQAGAIIRLDALHTQKKRLRPS